MHVGCDDVRDLWIAACGLLIDEQNNRLPVLRNLNRSQWDAIREKLPPFDGVDRLSLQTQAGTVGLLAHNIGRRKESAILGRAKPVMLCATSHPNRSF